MMSTRLPRRLNETEGRFASPRIVSIIGIQDGEPELVKKYAWNYQEKNRPKPPKVSDMEWKQVSHVPASLSGWDSANDSLSGNSVYGDPNDNTTAWSIQFNETDFTKYKVESGDKTYVVECNKDNDANGQSI